MDKLEQFTKWVEEIANGKSPKIPYNLHEGTRKCIEVFGSAGKFKKFLEEIRTIED